VNTVNRAQKQRNHTEEVILTLSSAETMVPKKKKCSSSWEAYRYLCRNRMLRPLAKQYLDAARYTCVLLFDRRLISSLEKHKRVKNFRKYVLQQLNVRNVYIRLA
jgi:hypothetical protein